VRAAGSSAAAANRLHCFGDNSASNNALASPTGTATQYSSSNAPDQPGALSLGGGRFPVQVAVRYRHACALDQLGGVHCWGFCSGTGACGSGGAASNISLVVTVGESSAIAATALFVGFDHTAVVNANGSLVGWGTNSNGELALGHNRIVDVPYPAGLVSLPSGKAAAAVCFGTAFACVLTTAGDVTCAGQSSFGQLGLGNTQR